MYLLEQLVSPDASAVLFECLAGSRAYGTANAESDDDIRGIFAVPVASYLDLERPVDQVSDSKNNVVYYSIRRIIELLAEANPNVLELLYMPDECVRRISPEMNLLVAARDLFVTKQCADTHAGYAYSQVKKARGQNKWINNPKPELPPRKEQYCHVVPPPSANASGPPARPIPLETLGLDLTQHHAAKLEHARDAYRLYFYGSAAQGVFRGDVIACESIPEADESKRFAGLLFFNEAGWKQALIDHQNYWRWRKERNEARWRQQESGELDFDAKNMMHTIRLLMSGRSLLEHGKPMVRFAGADLALLMAIRNGRLSFDEILKIADALRADCERLRDSVSLPSVCDKNAASKLLQSITTAWQQRCRA